MTTLSTGDPSTLGSYLKLCVAAFGADSAPAKYFSNKIKESPRGEAEEVIAHESQMMYLIGTLLK